MKFMATLILLALSLALLFPLTSTFPTLHKGSSLSTEKSEDVLSSPNGVFSAGFYPVGENAYCFAIWFNHPSQSQPHTIVWMANRDHPVNGRRSKLSLLQTGNLILTDAGKFTVWASDTLSHSPVQLSLNNTGNLVLHTLEGESLWESFDFPTDTLLPQQQLTRNIRLVSSRSRGNYSSGFYKLLFDNNNLLRLLFDGLEISSIYWPDTWLVSRVAGRSTDNKSRIAVLDLLGNFSSSDRYNVMSADNGVVLHRRLTVDYDGNIRLHSWEEKEGMWVISWQAIQRPCTIHGICGPNGICSYVADYGRKCSCIPGYKLKNHTDWSYGCEPRFNLSCNKNDSGFLLLSHVEFFGYDFGYFPNYTLSQCTNLCLQWCNCKGFQFKFNDDGVGFTKCYPKMTLLNGHRSQDFKGDLYLRVPESNRLSYANSVQEFRLDCSSEGTVKLDRTYVKSRPNGTVKILLWFACGLGGLEVVCIVLVWCLLIRGQQSWGADKQGYLPAATGFRKFTYAELKKATKGFSEEIGRGAGGTVYRGVLSDGRVAAIKRLSEANQAGESEFLAEQTQMGVNETDDGGETEDRRLVTWVREKKNRMAATTASWMEEIIDPIMEGTYEMGKMEILVGMALQCVKEDKDERPTMSQVVEVLLSHDNDHYN
ncbi:hypothetical protein FH972_018049 [Carpinus fangiana]|uniref:Receptor-like serine/threonine-protein kinase n=1 Tax=Carpinus fangiana TaxID=176857 RepID=A0A5N6RKS4_9ROSI|nr:hypothetical protein FH972_018049 [Carpinus fangiana]